MDFTTEQFLSVFTRYNEAIWPLQLLAYALGLGLVALAFARWAGRARLISAGLALLWAWMGGAFMWAFFADLTKAGYLFGALFVIEAALLVGFGVARHDVRFEPCRGVRLVAGASMIVYALAVYPVIGALTGHGYPDGPLFGVAPCPTTIFTLGLFLMAGRLRKAVWAVPLWWSFQGSFAAFQTGITEDYGLLLSGVVTVVVLVVTRKASSAASGERRERPQRELPRAA